LRDLENKLLEMIERIEKVGVKTKMDLRRMLKDLEDKVG
jgi:uncharacterized membrane protein